MKKKKHPEQGNVGMMHRECASKRKEEWQKNNVGLELNVNDYVKVGFPIIGNSFENMWVKITQIRRKWYVGKLQNTPFFATYVKHGDLVEFTFDEIVDHETKNVAKRK